jgi:hypothetical protein
MVIIIKSNNLTSEVLAPQAIPVEIKWLSQSTTDMSYVKGWGVGEWA